MFPLQPGDELVFSQQQNIPQDQIFSSVDATTSPSPTNKGTISHNNNTGKSRRRATMSTSDFNGAADKKMMHRDIERQRRQEMTTLHSSLRSLLPLEFVKGKRSVSDQMNEAVNYIKHLQNNIKELNNKKDQLKRLTTGSSSFSSGTTSCDRSSNCVVVHPSLAGAEIIISSEVNAQVLTLSRILQFLIEEEGLSVLSCVSTIVADQLVHTIQAKINDPERLSLLELQGKLNWIE